MSRYQFYPTLLNSFIDYQTEKTLGESYILCNKQQLLDKINRVPFPQTDPMKKGIAFEYCLQNEGVYSHLGFDFDKELVDSMRPFVEGGVWQQFVETDLEVDGHQVRLYGFVDVIRFNQTIDVKTGKQYHWPGYSGYFQQHVYLLGAEQAGCVYLQEHVYLITDFKEYYLESYDFNREVMINQLKVACRDLMSFVDNNRKVITDKKIVSYD